MVPTVMMTKMKGYYRDAPFVGLIKGFQIVLFIALFANLTAQHSKVSDFDKFPKWFLDSHEEGFYITGWTGGHNYSIFSYLINVTSPGCKLTRVTDFYWSLMFTNDKANQRCILKYKNNGGIKAVVLEETMMPHPTCSDPTESYVYIKTEQKAPGERIVYCRNESMFETWYEFQNKTGCYNVYLKPIYRECSVIKSGSRKLLGGCSVEIVGGQTEGHNDVTVTTGNDGTIQLKSEKFIRSEHCNLECTIDVGNIQELTITCPDGSQHQFTLNEDLTKRCWGTNTPYIRWLSLLVCKSTYHPWLIVLLLVWSLTSHVCLSIFFLFLSTISQWYSSRIKKVQKEGNPELGACTYCKSNFLTEEMIKKHLTCATGQCHICGSTLLLKSLPVHTLRCVESKNFKTNVTESLTAISKSMKVSRCMLSLSLNNSALQSIRWLGFLIIFCLIFIPPVGSAPTVTQSIGTTNEHQEISEPELNEEMVEVQNYEDSIWNEMTELDQVDALGYLDELKNELEFCGSTCANSESTCSCPNWDESTVEMKPQILTIPNHEANYEITRIRQKRQTSKLSIIADIESVNSSGAISHISDHAGKLFKLPQKLTVDGIKSARPNGAKQYVEFHQASKVLTNWGMLTISSEYQPAESDNSISLTWDSYKKDRNNVYIKGSSTATIEVSKGNGLVYTLSNPDSDETLKISTFIYDYSQKYTTTLKYVTTNRKIHTWYRGVCTGNCPAKCACNKPTCVSKKWDYDRGITCNPTWCWALNSGCSCCALDVDGRSSDWIIAVYEVRYESTEIVVCQSTGFDRFGCRVISDSTAIDIEGFRFTYSKIRSTNYRLPDRIAAYWKLDGKSKFKQSMPDGILLNPDICDSGCNHGDIGDYKANDLSFLYTEPNSTHPTESMNWQGIDIEHTCHFGSWPDCEFYGLQQDISDKFDHVIKSSEHLNERFIPQRVLVHRNSQLEIRVRPKSQSGNIDTTLQVKNYSLKRKMVKPKFSNFRLLTCSGCFGCISGFECTFTLKLNSPEVYNAHLIAKDSFIVVSQTTFRLESSPNFRTNFNIRCFSLLNISSISLYIREDMTLSSTVDVHLGKPPGILTEFNSHIGIENKDLSKCGGFFGLVTCTGKNVINFASRIGSNITNLFSSWYEAAKLGFYLVCGILLMYALTKGVLLVKTLCISKDQTVIYQDPAALLKAGTRKGK